jgi:hypothetical protein
MINSSSEQEMVTLSSKRPTNAIKRPPSYSDSFFFMPEYMPLEDFRQLPQLDVSNNLLQPRKTVTTIWIIRILSFGIHITLIGIFETIFYFSFISKSEDAGIQGTVQNYIQGIITDCKSWPSNTTEIISEILSILINTTQIQHDAIVSAEKRESYNNALQLKAWLYVITLLSLIGAGGGITYWKGVRVPWRRILLENIVMVLLLGLYEFFFFKTIIYNYKSLSIEELNGRFVNELQTSCGVL